jgi:hypothetical protein
MVDNFSVGVRLKDDREIHFFSFLGAGEFHHDETFPDWCYWDEYVFDFAGTQEATSRLLVNLLCKIIGVTVMPPRH